MSAPELTVGLRDIGSAPADGQLDAASVARAASDVRPDPMRIAAVSLSPRPDSISRRLLELWREQAPASYVEFVPLDLQELPVRWAGGEQVSLVDGPFAAPARRLRSCAGYVLAYPVHCYTSASQAHWFIEVFGELLTAKPVALLTAAGTSRSHLAMDDVIRSLLFDVRAFVFPDTVQAVEQDVLANGQLEPALGERVRAAAHAFVDFCVALRPLTEAGEPGSFTAPTQFVELYVRDLDPYVELFAGCLDYLQVRRIGGWCDLRRPGDRILLNAEDGDRLHLEHPFRGHRGVERRGYGLELAIAVPDVDASYERVARLGWKMEAPRRRAWGTRDFRVRTDDGYYLRITERLGL